MFENVNTFVKKVCAERCISASVYCSGHSDLRDCMSAFDKRDPILASYVEKYCLSARECDCIIVIGYGVAQEAEKILQSNSIDEWFASAKGPQQPACSGQSLTAMAFHECNYIPFIQAFTAMLHHEITHIERNHCRKTSYAALAAPCIGALSYYALSRIEHLCMPSQSWMSYVAYVPKLMISALISYITPRLYMRHAEYEADDGIPFACPAYAQLYELHAQREQDYSFMRRLKEKLFSVHPRCADRVKRIMARNKNK